MEKFDDEDFEDLRDEDKKFFEDLNIKKTGKNMGIYFEHMSKKIRQMWKMIKDNVEEEFGLNEPKKENKK